MTSPDTSRYIFQWHPEGPAAPITWAQQDEHGIRSYECWAPLDDLFAGPGDESTQTWQEFCSELKLPDNIRQLYNAGDRVKTWNQLTRDMALPEEWGFRTQFTAARAADDVKLEKTVIAPAYHTRDAGWERGGDKGRPEEGRTGAREVRFKPKFQFQKFADVGPPVQSVPAAEGIPPSEITADYERARMGIEFLCKSVDIPSRCDELDRRVIQLAGPNASETERLIARVHLMENQSLQNDLAVWKDDAGRKVGITDPDERRRYAQEHDFRRDLPRDLRYRDSLKEDGWRGKIPEPDIHEQMREALGQMQAAGGDDQAYQAAKERYERAEESLRKLEPSEVRRQLRR